MARNSIRRLQKARIFLLVGALLMTVFLFEEFTYHKTTYLRDVKTKVYQTRAPTIIKSPAFPEPRCEQNLTAAKQANFSSFTSNFQDLLYYRHCRHFPMLLDVPDKCGGANESSDVFLLMVIKSSPANYDRREVLRKTSAKERLQNGVWIRSLFIVGTTDTGLMKDRMNKLLELENREYNDILQWDFKDTFYNLTLKQILFLGWMERNCPHVRYVINGDDDVFFHTDNIVEYLQSREENDESKHLFLGSLMVYSPPVRVEKSRYFVSYEMFEGDHFPPYCSGGGFIMSAYTASVIYNMSKSIGIIPIDDAYMGMCLDKAGLKPTSHMGVNPHSWHIPSDNIDQFDPCYLKSMLLVHGFKSTNTFAMWHSVHDPNLKCGITKKLVFKW